MRRPARRPTGSGPAASRRSSACRLRAPRVGDLGMGGHGRRDANGFQRPIGRASRRGLSVKRARRAGQAPREPRRRHSTSPARNRRSRANCEPRSSPSSRSPPGDSDLRRRAHGRRRSSHSARGRRARSQTTSGRTTKAINAPANATGRAPRSSCSGVPLEKQDQRQGHCLEQHEAVRAQAVERA